MLGKTKVMILHETALSLRQGVLVTPRLGLAAAQDHVRVSRLLLQALDVVQKLAGVVALGRPLDGELLPLSPELLLPLVLAGHLAVESVAQLPILLLGRDDPSELVSTGERGLDVLGMTGERLRYIVVMS